MDLILKYDPKADILAIKLKEKTLKTRSLRARCPSF
jgi:uncharacterized protein YuzE